MGAAKIRTLIVRPGQSSDLTFDRSGVIEWQRANVQVGSRLQSADMLPFASTTEELSKRDSSPAKAVIYDAKQIDAVFGGKALFRLRNIAEQASLANVIHQRNINFLRVYHDSDKVSSLVVQAAAESHACIKEAVTRNKAMYDEINAAYLTKDADRWKGVRKTIYSSQRVAGTAYVDTYWTPVGMKTPTHLIKATPEGSGSKQTVDEVTTEPVAGSFADNGTFVRGTPKESPFKTQIAKSREDEQERTTDVDAHALWSPTGEHQLGFQRTQDQLIREELSRHLAVIATKYQRPLMDAELGAFESDVLRIQANMLATFLFPPYPGIVTAIYKDPGEFVQAGEPVLRVDNDQRIFMAGQIVYSGRIFVGQDVTVSTEYLYDVQLRYKKKGKVVSVRGHQADNDEWEVLIEIENILAPVLPLNFSFDQRTTNVEFG